MASAMTPEQRVQQFLDMEAQQSNVDHEVLAWLTAANVDAKLLRSDLTAILATRASLAEAEAQIASRAVALVAESEDHHATSNALTAAESRVAELLNRIAELGGEDVR